MLDDYLQYGMVFKQSSITLKGFSPVYKDLFEGFLNHLRQNRYQRIRFERGEAGCFGLSISLFSPELNVSISSNCTM